jgi:hypothetical protein
VWLWRGECSRHNYHYRQLGADLSQSVPNGTYYVAVFNNDIYLHEIAKYTLSVRVTRTDGDRGIRCDLIWPQWPCGPLRTVGLCNSGNCLNRELGGRPIEI